MRILRKVTGCTSREEFSRMSAKEKCRANLRFHAFMTIYSLALLGLALGLEFGTGVYHSRLSASIWETVLVLSAVTNARGALKIRALLRNPLFYLVAIRHDLGGGD